MQQRFPLCSWDRSSSGQSKGFPFWLLLPLLLLPNCLEGSAGEDRRETQGLNQEISCTLFDLQGLPLLLLGPKMEIFSWRSFSLHLVHTSGFGLPLHSGQEIPEEEKTPKHTNKGQKLRRKWAVEINMHFGSSLPGSVVNKPN